MIREQEPSRLGSIDADCRGDVETIVAKALEKDPARRYPSAADLAADIRPLPAPRADPGAAAVGAVPAAQVRPAAQGAWWPGWSGIVAALVLGTVVSRSSSPSAPRQRGQAEQNARVANDEKREAMYQAYRARLAAAVAALSHHDVADAARQLDAAPEDLRGWEWRHLHSRLDDSSR